MLSKKLVFSNRILLKVVVTFKVFTDPQTWHSSKVFVTWNFLKINSSNFFYFCKGRESTTQSRLVLSFERNLTFKKGKERKEKKRKKRKSPQANKLHIASDLLIPSFLAELLNIPSFPSLALQTIRARNKVLTGWLVKTQLWHTPKISS